MFYFQSQWESGHINNIFYIIYIIDYPRYRADWGNFDAIFIQVIKFAAFLNNEKESLFFQFQAFWEKEKSKLDKVNLDEVIAKARTNIAWQNIHYEEMKKLLVPWFQINLSR